jgi:drug/metabolite transporter (DMT)-like permease
MAASAMWTGIFSAVVGKEWWIERVPFWSVLGVTLVMAGVVRRLKKVSERDI